MGWLVPPARACFYSTGGSYVLGRGSSSILALTCATGRLFALCCLLFRCLWENEGLARDSRAEKGPLCMYYLGVVCKGEREGAEVHHLDACLLCCLCLRAANLCATSRVRSCISELRILKSGHAYTVKPLGFPFKTSDHGLASEVTCAR